MSSEGSPLFSLSALYESAEYACTVHLSKIHLSLSKIHLSSGTKPKAR